MRPAVATLAAALAALPLATTGTAQDAPKAPAGFVALFNGKDLTGWKGHTTMVERAKLSKDDLAKKQAERTKTAFEHWKVVDGVIHYCVANMPGAVARTATFALNNATLPFAVKLANLGAEAAMRADAHLAAGLNVYRGNIAYKAVADDLGLAYQAWNG